VLEAPLLESIRVKRRASTLVELLTAIALLGATAYVCFTLIWPVFFKASLLLSRGNDELYVQNALKLLRSDLASSGPAGRSFYPKEESWLLGIVPFEQVDSEGKSRWQQTLILYRYSASSQTLLRGTFANLTWPDGSPRLPGDTPVLFGEQELLALPEQRSKVIAKNIQADAWPKLQETWKFRHTDSHAKERTFFVDLSGFL